MNRMMNRPRVLKKVRSALGKPSTLLNSAFARHFASNTGSATKTDANTLLALRAIEKKSIFLSTYMIHNANNAREKFDGLKVGGHQASSTSMSTILTALYFGYLDKRDRVSVKPHASPIFHSLQYLMGNHKEETLKKFRSFGGIQSYPSKTKDLVDIDFSTGSVGLGASITSFAAFSQDWLRLKGFHPKNSGDKPGKMISIIGDAELDEGNVYESLVESWKQDFKNNWFIVDYNRQSLDKISEENTWRQIDRMFQNNGWEVITLKYGKDLQRLFDRGNGGKMIKKWFNRVQNDTFSSLVYRGGNAFRKQILQDIEVMSAEDGTFNKDEVTQLLSTLDDEELNKTLTNLGGHCFETILEAFHKADSGDKKGLRTCFIAYTIKGHGLPIQGHKDNHGLFLNNKQMEQLQAMHGVPAGEEWAMESGLTSIEKYAMKQLVRVCPFKYGVGKGFRDFFSTTETYDIPDMFYQPESKQKQPVKQSSQAAFGLAMMAVGASTESYADRVMTIAPDVATSTNLGGFVGNRGVFGLKDVGDRSKELKVMSMNKWAISGKGQHVELGIAENNLFLMLAAAGMSSSLFEQRILPVGTLYDPFISRGLDALNYGCYQDSRFLLVATPSGISLAPEGGAHQSINTPLIGMSQPGLVYMEPTFADEVQVCMSHAFRIMQLPANEGGNSVYLRLSTRPIEQIPREMTTELRAAILKGAYWHDDGPTAHTKVCIAFTGVIYPEAREAVNRLRQELGGPPDTVALLHVTSPDRFYNDCHDNIMQSNTYAQSLLSGLPRDAPIITAIDGYPSTLSWLGSVKGNRLRSLGVSTFGQSGTIPDLYRRHLLDSEAIVDASMNMLKMQQE